MGENKKLSAEELAELRAQLKKEAGIEDTLGAGADADDDEEEGVFGKKVYVTISEDGMKAYVRLNPVTDGSRYTVPEVKAALRNNRVVTGVSTTALMEMIGGEVYDEDVLVAEGKEVTAGTEGFFEFMIDMESKRTPEILEDGSVDYSSMNRVANVDVGDLIAIYHPAVQGSKGNDVCGKELIPRYCRDLMPLRGQHVERRGDKYYANMAGRISLSGNNIEILSVFEIDEDVTYGFGNVDFFGDVEIHGNVDSGVTIRAGGKVTISGTVGSATIYAGGDVILERGIQGGGEGKVSSNGSVFAEFIEFATINAKGDIRANYFLDSKVKASGMVYAEGKKGSVIGGEVHGLKGIEIRNAGNITETRSVIHAGFETSEYEKYSQLLHDEKKAKDKIRDLVEEMSELLVKGKKDGVNKAQKEKILKINEKKTAVYTELEEIAGKKNELATRMAQSSRANIKIHDTCYVNTMLAIGIAVTIINREEYRTKYICRNDQIERRAL